METRPRLQIIPNRFDNILELLSKVLLLVMWAMTLIFYFRLPAVIPVHFTGSGQVDSYGDRATLFILPFTTTALYFGLTALNRYPHNFNYITKITDNNAPKQYAIAIRMLRVIKLAVVLTFTLLILFIYLATAGLIKGPGVWFLIFLEVLFIGVPIVFISKSVKKENR